MARLSHDAQRQQAYPPWNAGPADFLISRWYGIRTFWRALAIAVVLILAGAALGALLAFATYSPLGAAIAVISAIVLGAWLGIRSNRQFWEKRDPDLMD